VNNELKRMWKEGLVGELKVQSQNSPRWTEKYHGNLIAIAGVHVEIQPEMSTMRKNSTYSIAIFGVLNMIQVRTYILLAINIVRSA
jgi:hypothetical protein